MAPSSETIDIRVWPKAGEERAERYNFDETLYGPKTAQGVTDFCLEVEEHLEGLDKDAIERTDLDTDTWYIGKKEEWEKEIAKMAKEENGVTTNFTLQLTIDKDARSSDFGTDNESEGEEDPMELHEQSEASDTGTKNGSEGAKEEATEDPMELGD